MAKINADPRRIAADWAARDRLDGLRRMQGLPKPPPLWVLWANVVVLASAVGLILYLCCSS